VILISEHYSVGETVTWGYSQTKRWCVYAEAMLAWIALDVWPGLTLAAGISCWAHQCTVMLS